MKCYTINLGESVNVENCDYINGIKFELGQAGSYNIGINVGVISDVYFIGDGYISDSESGNHGKSWQIPSGGNTLYVVANEANCSFIVVDNYTCIGLGLNTNGMGLNIEQFADRKDITILSANDKNCYGDISYMGYCGLCTYIYLKNNSNVIGTIEEYTDKLVSHITYYITVLLNIYGTKIKFNNAYLSNDVMYQLVFSEGQATFKVRDGATLGTYNTVTRTWTYT